MSNVIFTLLIGALAAVEDATTGTGDGGRAHGPLQIHAAVVADVNRIYGQHFTLSDARNADRAAQMCQMYLAYFASPARLGRRASVEDLARIWNGGPRGCQKHATREYAQRVRNVYTDLLQAGPAACRIATTSPPLRKAGFSAL